MKISSENKFYWFFLNAAIFDQRINFCKNIKLTIEIRCADFIWMIKYVGDKKKYDGWEERKNRWWTKFQSNFKTNHKTTQTGHKSATPVNWYNQKKSFGKLCVHFKAIQKLLLVQCMWEAFCSRSKCVRVCFGADFCGRKYFQWHNGRAANMVKRNLV